MEQQLKDKQKQILRFIYDYTKSNDCAPKREEIAETLGISLSAVHYRIHYLFDYGYLGESEASDWGRNIALTKKGILACEGKE